MDISKQHEKGWGLDTAESSEAPRMNYNIEIIFTCC